MFIVKALQKRSTCHSEVWSTKKGLILLEHTELALYDGKFSKTQQQQRKWKKVLIVSSTQFLEGLIWVYQDVYIFFWAFKKKESNLTSILEHIFNFYKPPQKWFFCQNKRNFLWQHEKNLKRIFGFLQSQIKRRLSSHLKKEMLFFCLKAKLAFDFFMTLLLP